MIGVESVVAKNSTSKFYVRSKSSTIEAKGEILDEVRELANRIPFDKLGYVAMTNPDKPTSAKQAYMLTQKGKKLME